MNRKNAMFCDDPLATSCDHRVSEDCNPPTQTHPHASMPLCVQGRTTGNERFKEYTPIDREERDRQREERRREREREREERESLFASIAGQNQMGSGLFGGLRTPPAAATPPNPMAVSPIPPSVTLPLFVSVCVFSEPSRSVPRPAAAACVRRRRVPRPATTETCR